ncbi:hypothetical protein T03_8339 [Trichinella britovi]|uniref:Uncharacterized protein n=1 Tax=Trichinella britovi TaxID=45882 RepID=A0A0V0Z1F2_TRIBR|nr:hypothetical protein T03_8339 [Trichinella britovi]
MKKVTHRSRAALPLARRCILENFEYGINHRFHHQLPKQPVGMKLQMIEIMYVKLILHVL